MNRPKPDRPTATSPLIYLALSVLAFYPCLFKGLAYFDNDLLAQFGPWRLFLKDQLAQGHFPLWNPYHMGGQPFFADPQSMASYPFNWLTLPFSLTRGLGLFFTLHLFWAAWGMDLWLSTFGLSPLSRRVGALTFALSGFFWLEIIHPPVIAAFAWLPWLFLALEKFAQGPTASRAFWAGLAFANLFLAGSPQMSLGAFYGGLGYLLWRGWKWKARPALKVMLLLIWGALPLLSQAIPSLEFISLTGRGATPTYQQAGGRYSLDQGSLYQFFLPRFSLPPDRSMAEAIQFGENGDDTHMAANLGYLGLWAPFLAFWAFRGKDRPWWLGLAALAGLLLSLGYHTPLHRALCALLPGLSYVHVPYRFLFLYVLPMAVLAAIGFEKFFQKDERQVLSRPSLHSGLAYGVLLYFVALWRPALNWRELLALGLVQLGLFAAVLGRRKPWLERGRKLALLGLVLPLLLSGWDDFRPEAASNFDYRTNSGPLVQAGRSLGDQRVIFYNHQMDYPVQVDGRLYVLNYPQNCSSALGIKNWGGYNPLVLRTKQSIGTLPLKAQLQLGAIGGVFSQGRLAPVPGFTEEKHGPYYLYRHRPPMPLAYAPNEVVYGMGPAKTLEAMRDPLFDAAKRAYLSSGGDFRYQVNTQPAKLQCHLAGDSPNRQLFLVELDKPSLVVFCEVMFPGWKAFVDGNPAGIFTADHFLRAVALPEGKHAVEFRFEPRWWAPIKTGLCLWLVLTLLGFWWALGRRNPFYLLLQGIYYAIGGYGLGRVKVLRWAYNALFGLFKPRKVTVLGHTLWLDDKDTLELGRHGVYEPFETSLFLKEIKAGQTVVDVGANIGYYTLLAARLVGPEGRVYAFEPDPTNFSLLRKNVEANGYKNVVLVNKALSNKNGKTKLFINPKNRGDHRVYDSGDGRNSVTIETITLDSYLKNRKVDFIKMDIQGAEPLALEGMKKTLRASKGLKLITEFSPDSIKLAKGEPKRYLAALTALGFNLSEVSEKNKKLVPVTPAQLLKKDWNNCSYTNLLAVRK